VAEGVEVDVAGELAGVQLCRPSDLASESFAVPAARADHPLLVAAPCDASYRCLGGVVMGCEPPRHVALCTHGCVSEGATVDANELTEDQAVAILCLR
jgi:hypothetical protein